MKKKTKRNANKFPAFKPTLNLKSRYDELTDFDYLHKLSDKDKQWMHSFLEESINANFNHGGEVLHKTKTQKKKCYDKNNARNRDVYSKAKASGKLVYAEGIYVTGEITEEDPSSEEELSEDTLSPRNLDPKEEDDQ